MSVGVRRQYTGAVHRGRLAKTDLLLVRLDGLDAPA